MTRDPADRTVRIRDRVEDPGRGEVVVALPDVDVVVQALNGCHLRAKVRERNELLGLALLKLEPGADPAGLADEDSEPKLPDGREMKLPDLITALRDWFRAHHGGWVPTMGRNRVIDHVTGVGEISYGGKGDPVVVSDASWGLRKSTPGHGVRVGVLDTKLSPNTWLEGACKADSAAILQPDAAGSALSAVEGHATFVTGLILSQAPGAAVELYPVLHASGEADCWSAAKAIARAGQDDLDVLNLSFVCFTDDGEPPLALATAIARVPSSTVIVAAAGNQGELTEPLAMRPSWPAAFDNVVAVGASTESGGPRATFSPEEPWVDCLAPGVKVLSTYLDGRVALPGDAEEKFTGFARWNGTSFSAALVSGRIAAGVHRGSVDARTSWSRVLRKAVDEHAAGTAKPSVAIEPPTTAGP